MITSRIQNIISGNRWSILLGLLLFDYLLNSFVAHGVWSDLASVIFSAIIFVGVIGAVEHPRIVDIAGLSLIGLWAGLSVISEVYEVPYISEMEVVAAGIILFGALTITFLQLLKPAVSEREKLFSAVFGYLLLAMIWALVYWRVYQAFPEAFNLPEADQTGQSSPFFYFSLVTMTTLGYGEITPAAAITRTLAGLQAVVGTLYIAVLIGQIVGRLR